MLSDNHVFKASVAGLFGARNVAFWPQSDMPIKASDVGCWCKSGRGRGAIANPLMMLWTAPTLRHRSAIGWLR